MATLTQSSTPAAAGEGIGAALRRREDPRLLRGRGRFVDDLTFPGMLHAKIVRSPYPHARIKAIRTERALALEGVHAVVTGKDMPVLYGIIPWTQDEYPLALEKALYIGDGVAAVAATSEHIAAKAAKLIVLPPV